MVMEPKIINESAVIVDGVDREVIESYAKAGDRFGNLRNEQAGDRARVELIRHLDGKMKFFQGNQFDEGVGEMVPWCDSHARGHDPLAGQARLELIGVGQTILVEVTEGKHRLAVECPTHASFGVAEVVVDRGRDDMAILSEARDRVAVGVEDRIGLGSRSGGECREQQECACHGSPSKKRSGRRCALSPAGQERATLQPLRCLWLRPAGTAAIYRLLAGVSILLVASVADASIISQKPLSSSWAMESESSVYSTGGSALAFANESVTFENWVWLRVPPTEQLLVTYQGGGFGVAENSIAIQASRSYEDHYWALPLGGTVTRSLVVDARDGDLYFAWTATAYPNPDGPVHHPFSSVGLHRIRWEPVTELAGDFNFDGSVDAADYTVWRDGNGTLEDYQAWKDNFGSHGIGSLPVPESSGAYLISLLLIVAYVGRYLRGCWYSARTRPTQRSHLASIEARSGQCSRVGDINTRKTVLSHTSEPSWKNWTTQSCGRSSGAVNLFSRPARQSGKSFPYSKGGHPEMQGFRKLGGAAFSHDLIVAEQTAVEQRQSRQNHCQGKTGKKFHPSSVIGRLAGSQILLVVILLLTASPAMAALVAHWPLNDNAASTTVVATVGTNATLAGGENTADVTVAGPGGSITAGFGLDGNDSVSITVASPDALDAWSVSLWFKLSTTSGTLLGQAGATSGRIVAWTNTVIRVTDTGGTSLEFTVPAMGTADWHHLLVARTAGNPKNVRLFMDGTESSSGTLTASSGMVWSDLGVVNSVYFVGSLAQVKIFDSEESANVAALYAEGTGGGGTSIPAIIHRNRQNHSHINPRADPVVRAGYLQPFAAHLLDGSFALSP